MLQALLIAHAPLIVFAAMRAARGIGADPEDAVATCVAEVVVVLSAGPGDPRRAIARALSRATRDVQGWPNPS